MMDTETEQAAIRLSAQQRWIAAQALAAGDTLARAAVEAGTRKAILEWLLDHDEEFRELLESEQALGEMDEDAWNRHAERKMRQTIDRLLALNRVAAVSLAARLCGVLDALRQRGRGAPVDSAEDGGSVEDFLRSLGEDKLAEFESWGQRRYFGPGTPNDPHRPLHTPDEDDRATSVGLRLVGIAEDAATFEPAPATRNDPSKKPIPAAPAQSPVAGKPLADAPDAWPCDPSENPPVPAGVDDTPGKDAKDDSGGRKAGRVDHAAFFKPAREPLPWHLRPSGAPRGHKPP